MSILSDADKEFLIKAMACMKSMPDLDTERLATILGIKRKSVCNRWGEIKKKLFDPAVSVPATIAEQDEDAEEPAPKKARVTKVPAKAKAKAATGLRVTKAAPKSTATSTKATRNNVKKAKAAAEAKAATEAELLEDADAYLAVKAEDEDIEGKSNDSLTAVATSTVGSSPVRFVAPNSPVSLKQEEMGV